MSYFYKTFPVRTNQLVIIISKLNNSLQVSCAKLLLESYNLLSKTKNTLISSKNLI